MPIRMNTSTSVNFAQRLLRANNRDLETRLQRLSSAVRVNRASDDAASLAISESLRGQIGGSVQAVRNAEQAVNATQTVEGTLNEVNGILIRMRELAAQASSGTLNDRNRASLQAEFAQLSAEVDRLAQTASDQTGVTDAAFQVGPNGQAADRVEFNLADLRASGSELNLGTQTVSSGSSAQQALSAVDQAILRVSAQRGDIGALQNRLGFRIRASENAIVNQQASESTLRDADIAEEVTALARARILRRSNTALLSQANLNRKRVLDLLG
ncbi:MAG: flagellin [bacterium]|nr:flagellin [bacterium]